VALQKQCQQYAMPEMFEESPCLSLYHTGGQKQQLSAMNFTKISCNASQSKTNTPTTRIGGTIVHMLTREEKKRGQRLILPTHGSVMRK